MANMGVGGKPQIAQYRLHNTGQGALEEVFSAKNRIDSG